MSGGADTAAEADALTAVAVTFAMAPPDDSYTRAGKLPTPAFVWARVGGPDAPLTGLKVVYDAEEPGADWTKLPEDLNRGGKGGSAFLCFARGTGSPLVELRVCASASLSLPLSTSLYMHMHADGAVQVLSDQDPEPVGFVMVERDCVRAAAGQLRFFVWYKTQASGACVRMRGLRVHERRVCACAANAKKDFNVGDLVDVRDTVNKWCIGRVKEKTEAALYIHYEVRCHPHAMSTVERASVWTQGWSEKWNEWISLASERLAMCVTRHQSRRACVCSRGRGRSYRTYTRGLATAPSENEKAFKLSGEELPRLEQVLGRIAPLADKRERELVRAAAAPRPPPRCTASGCCVDLPGGPCVCGGGGPEVGAERASLRVSGHAWRAVLVWPHTRELARAASKTPTTCRRRPSFFASLAPCLHTRWPRQQTSSPRWRKP